MIFSKWGLDAVEIGKLNSGKMEYFIIKLVGTLPKAISDSSPEYDRPSVKPRIRKD